MKILSTLKSRFQVLLSPLADFPCVGSKKGTDMFLKRVEGVRTVALPDGRVLSHADLPPTNTLRWVASRKESVVLAVRHGLLSRKSALEMYGLSDEELDSWDSALNSYGSRALKATQVQNYRQPREDNERLG